MSTVKVDTLVASDGTSPVTLTKQNTIKAFYDSKTTFGTADNSFGISSSSDAATGNTGINFTNSFDSAFYVAAGVSFDADGHFYNEQSQKIAASCEIRHVGGWNAGGSLSAVDADIEVMFTGDLA